MTNIRKIKIQVFIKGKNKKKQGKMSYYYYRSRFGVGEETTEQILLYIKAHDREVYHNTLPLILLIDELFEGDRELNKILAGYVVGWEKILSRKKRSIEDLALNLLKNIKKAFTVEQLDYYHQIANRIFEIMGDENDQHKFQALSLPEKLIYIAYLFDPLDQLLYGVANTVTDIFYDIDLDTYKNNLDPLLSLREFLHNEETVYEAKRQRLYRFHRNHPNQEPTEEQAYEIAGGLGLGSNIESLTKFVSAFEAKVYAATHMYFQGNRYLKMEDERLIEIEDYIGEEAKLRRLDYNKKKSKFGYYYRSRFGAGRTAEEQILETRRQIILHIKAHDQEVYQNTLPLILLLDELFDGDRELNDILAGYDVGWEKILFQKRRSINDLALKLLKNVKTFTVEQLDHYSQIADRIFELLGPEENQHMFQSLHLPEKLIYIAYLFNPLDQLLYDVANLKVGNYFEIDLNIYKENLDPLLSLRETLHNEEVAYEAKRRRLFQFRRDHPNQELTAQQAYEIAGGLSKLEYLELFVSAFEAKVYAATHSYFQTMSSYLKMEGERLINLEDYIGEEAKLRRLDYKKKNKFGSFEDEHKEWRKFQDEVERLTRIMYQNVLPLIFLVVSLDEDGNTDIAEEYNPDWALPFCQNVNAIRHIVDGLLSNDNQNMVTLIYKHKLDKLTNQIFEHIGPARNQQEFRNLSLPERLLFINCLLMSGFCDFLQKVARLHENNIKLMIKTLSDNLNYIQEAKQLMETYENNYQEARRKLFQFRAKNGREPNANEMRKIMSGKIGDLGLTADNLTQFDSYFKFKLHECKQKYFANPWANYSQNDIDNYVKRNPKGGGNNPNRTLHW